MPPDDNTPTIAASYATIAYDARPNPVSHPDHLAAIARMFGLDVPGVDRARVLEVGCSDGANLLPVAATLRDVHCVGCDLAPNAIELARETTTALGLRNVEWLACDLRELPPDPQPFDYIVAHGVYSWVPAPVRDALFDLAARTLAPKGVLFLSYNVYPGGHTRRAVSEMMLQHTASLPTLPEKLAAARQLAALLSDAGAMHRAADAGIRAELQQIGKATDSELAHDAMAVPNDYFYFREVAEHARHHGLAYLAEAAPQMMSGVGLSPNMRAYLARLGHVAREQYNDYARLRRFRQSLFCRADAPSDSGLKPSRMNGLHATASMALLDAAREGRLPGEQDARAIPQRNLLERLIAAEPGTVPVEALMASAGGARADSASQTNAEAMILEAWMSGFMQFRTVPLPVAKIAGARPEAFALARLQAKTREGVTNLRHETIRLPDPFARTLLALLDGTRDRSQIVRTLASGSSPAETASIARRVDDTLASLAQFGLMMR